MPRLMPFTLYSDAMTEEFKEAGRTRISPIELADRWRNLSDEDKKLWEDKAAAAQEAFLKECTQKYLEADADEGDAGEPDEDEDARDDADEGEGDDDGAEDDGSQARISTTLALPHSRVKRITRDHVEVGLVSNEAVFAAGKVCPRPSPRNPSRRAILTRVPPHPLRRPRRSSSSVACGASCG